MSDQAPEKDVTLTDAENSVPEDDSSVLWAEMKEADAKSEEPPEGRATEEHADTEEENPPAPSAGEPQDIWASAPENLRAEFEALQAEKAKLEQQARSANGRLAARTRKINELRAQAEKVAAKQPAIDTTQLRSLETDYPEIAQPLNSTVSAISSRLESIEAEEEGRRKAAATELQGIIQEETSRLEEAIPDWLDFLRANGNVYRQWIEDQPKHIRDANARNANEITDADAAIEVITAFKQFLEPSAQPQPQNPTPSPNDRRKRQLAASSSPSSSPRGAVISGIPEDGNPEDLWAMFREQDRRQASR